jgi:hypothetical protein
MYNAQEEAEMKFLCIPPQDFNPEKHAMVWVEIKVL